MNFTPVTIIPDVSFWQDDNTTLRMIDFEKMRTQSYGVMIRAGQNTWVDSDVVENWKRAKAAGLKRGSYWFYDSRSTPQQQADLWKTALGNDFPELGLWCDFEENYGGPYASEAHMKQFCEAVRVRFPNVKIGVYSADWWWSGKTIIQNDYWATFPLWVAYYTSNPIFVTLPLPWRNKGAALWQYTDKGDGLKYGSESLNIDLNYTSQAFHDLFGNLTPAPSDVISTPYDGMTLKQGMVNGWDYCLFKIDPRKFRWEVVYLKPPETVSSVVKRKGAIAGWNAGDYNRFTYAIQDWLVTNGVEVMKRDPMGGRPSFQVLNTGDISIASQNLTNVAQAFTGIRPLVELGTVSSKLFDTTQAQNTEGHARFAFALDTAGNVLLFSSRGIHPSVTVFDGLKLFETAQVLQSNGAQSAADGGGGGDVAVVLNGQSLIEPENEENGIHFERLLPAALLLYQEQNMATRYTATAIGNDTRVRPDHNTGKTAIASYPANTVFSGDVIWTAPAPLFNASGVKYQEVGDVWLQTSLPVAGWVAVKNMGLPITTLKDNGVTPPPATTLPDLKVTIEAAGYPITVTTIKPL